MPYSGLYRLLPRNEVRPVLLGVVVIVILLLLLLHHAKNVGENSALSLDSGRCRARSRAINSPFPRVRPPPRHVKKNHGDKAIPYSGRLLSGHVIAPYIRTEIPNAPFPFPSLLYAVARVCRTTRQTARRNYWSTAGRYRSYRRGGNVPLV